MALEFSENMSHALQRNRDLSKNTRLFYLSCNSQRKFSSRGKFSRGVLYAPFRPQLVVGSFRKSCFVYWTERFPSSGLVFTRDVSISTDRSVHTNTMKPKRKEENPKCFDACPVLMLCPCLYLRLCGLRHWQKQGIIWTSGIWKNKIDWVALNVRVMWVTIWYLNMNYLPNWATGSWPELKPVSVLSGRQQENLMRLLPRDSKIVAWRNSRF